MEIIDYIIVYFIAGSIYILGIILWHYLGKRYKKIKQFDFDLWLWDKYAQSLKKKKVEIDV